MYDLEICWDPAKASRNARRHGISFEEAKTVFWDDNAILIDDPDHSFEEDRFLLLGMSVAARLLVVVHCYRESDTAVRLISARKATKTEQIAYVGRCL